MASPPVVARLIALTSRIPASIAAVNQLENCLIGSASRSLRRRPCAACSQREAAGSRGVSIIRERLRTILRSGEIVDPATQIRISHRAVATGETALPQAGAEI